MSSISYIPTFIKASLTGNRPVQLTFSEISDTNILSTSSFDYDSINSPLKSTQQLHVDWSNFENHTFFMSAEAKVNVAFDQIINGFPFDGTKREFEKFFEKLTGFEKWVYDQFPKYKGQLHFSGSALSETSSDYGSYIVIKDYAGSLYPEISKNKTGDSILNPKEKSISFEFDLKIPSIPTDGIQTVFQKLSGPRDGFSFYLMPTVSTEEVESRFSVLSGSTNLTISSILKKDQFNHICLTLDKESGDHFLSFFINSKLADKTKSTNNFGIIDIDKSDFIIGSGSSLQFLTHTITPQQTLSGTIDEFRIFHNVRSEKQQKLFGTKNIFSTDDLKLYYKFNEPKPPLMSSQNDVSNAIVIDSSGNSLHSLISNFYSFVDYDIQGNITGSSLRQDSSKDESSLMTNEQLKNSPILFPAHQEINILNEDFIISASKFDIANPNLITKLIPKHYLLDGDLYEGIEPKNENDLNTYGGNGIPGSGKISNVQLMVSLLYIWAKFFDEIKLYIDAFSLIRNVDYDTNKSTPNNFLYDIVKHYGIFLPPLFNRASVEQYVRGENIKDEISTSEKSIRTVQNELLRRVLINIPDVIRSKGTQHSIKSFLRSIGIDPENSIRLKEYGGANERPLEHSRENKRDIVPNIQLLTSSYMQSTFLSASRVEPGHPEISGQFVGGLSNNANDGLLTSGSWTLEKNVKYTKFSKSIMTTPSQSLSRLCISGSGIAGEKGVVSNLIATLLQNSSNITWFVRPGNVNTSPVLKLSLDFPNEGIFDGNNWNITYGCQRNDEIDSNVSSSYFLRAGVQSSGEIEQVYTTSSFFYELSDVPGEINTFRNISPENEYGIFLCVGENDHYVSSSIDVFLNDDSIDIKTKSISNTAMINNIKFWSKYISVDEWKEHVLNYASLGVDNAYKNYNFVKTQDGSFQKIRLHSIGKQSNKIADINGNIVLYDLSQNNNHIDAFGFVGNKSCFVNDIIDYSYISPYFDEATTNEKVRIRSLMSSDNIIDNSWIKKAPVYELLKNEEPIDDSRFSIEFSLIDALNKDIISMFSSLDEFNNILGSPELQFSQDYHSLEALRTVYFNRLHEKLNFKSFFEFYKWFDMSIGTFIEQLIPRKTNFKGTNFVIQSHMLERSKSEYKFYDMYLRPEEKQNVRDVLYVQFVEGTLKSR
jgi:hypothetical protein